MNVKILLEELKREISPGEWELLASEPCPFPISEHNRRTLLTMREQTDAAPGKVDGDRVKELRRRLSVYLERYMPAQPKGHKWIILASLYLTFILERPMHPAEAVHFRTERIAGKLTYLCPCKSPDEESVCYFCVCRPAPEKGESR